MRRTCAGDLAAMYGVATKALKRNLARFPEDFMFQLTRDEAKALGSQSVTLDATAADDGVLASRRGKHLKYSPKAADQVRRPSRVLTHRRSTKAHDQHQIQELKEP